MPTTPAIPKPTTAVGSAPEPVEEEEPEDPEEPDAPLEPDAAEPEPVVVPALEPEDVPREACTELFCAWMLDNILDWPALTAVALPTMVVMAAVPFEAEVAFAAAELIAALFVANGTRYVLMSAGKPENQLGVAVANSAAISLDAAAGLVKASATREDGRAVWRTE